MSELLFRLFLSEIRETSQTSKLSLPLIFYSKSMQCLPGVHPAVYDRIVHGITHGQPINSQIGFLDVVRVRYCRKIVRHNEI